MWQYVIKVAITAIVVVVVSELAKRESVWAAALAALPLTSLLAFIWLYLDTGDAARVIALSHGIFWFILPSLALFIVFPAVLRAGAGFWPSLAAGCVAMAPAYLLVAWVRTKVGG